MEHTSVMMDKEHETRTMEESFSDDMNGPVLSYSIDAVQILYSTPIFNRNSS